MANPIEETNRRQQKHWRVFLICFWLLVGALIVRYLFGTALREHGLNSHPVGIALLIGSLALCVTLLYQVFRLYRLARRVAADPHLREALC